MIAIEASLMAVFFLPIVLMESWVASYFLRIPITKAFGGAFVSNLVSTVIGIPLAWFIHFLLELAIMLTLSIEPGIVTNLEQSPVGTIVSLLLFILGSAWIGPGQLYWTVPAALLILLIPACWISIEMESSVLKRLWKQIDPSLIKQAARNMNLASYAVLYLLAFVWLCWGLSTHSL